MTWLLALLLLASTAFAEGTTSTIMWVPERAIFGTSTSWPGTDIERCISWVPALSITNANRMAWSITGGLGGGGNCSFTIYAADGNSIIATTGATDCSTTGTQEATGITNFSLTAGTKYLLCTCASTNGGSYLGSDAGVSNGITTLQNVLSVAIGGTATNGCGGATPPGATGTITPSAVNTPIILIGK